jgi:hypothetical protein
MPDGRSQKVASSIAKRNNRYERRLGIPQEATASPCRLSTDNRCTKETRCGRTLSQAEANPLTRSAGRPLAKSDDSTKLATPSVIRINPTWGPAAPRVQARVVPQVGGVRAVSAVSKTAGRSVAGVSIYFQAQLKQAKMITRAPSRALSWR